MTDTKKPPHPNDFGIPQEHWQAAEYFAEYKYNELAASRASNKRMVELLRELRDLTLARVVMGQQCTGNCNQGRDQPGADALAWLDAPRNPL